MILRQLISIRLRSVLSGLVSHDRSGAKAAGKGAKASVALLFLLVFAVFLLLFAQVFLTLRDPFVQSGMGWVYFGFMGLMIFLLGFIGSVFLTQTQLFESKDNEMLLAMPISPRTILASRLLSLLGVNYLYELLIALPCGVVYCMKYRVSAGGVTLFLLTCLLLPLLVLTCSALFGWVIAAVSSRMRRKNIVTMILTIVLFLGYMYFCFRWQYYIEQLAASGEMLSDVLRTALPPFYFLGTGIEGNLTSFLLFAAICIIPAAAVYALLSVSFVQITSTKKGTKRIEYREKKMRVSGVRKALLAKEIRHFLSSTTYMFNAGIGLIFFPIVAVYALVSRENFVPLLNTLDPDHTATGAVLCLLMGLISCLIIISAPSISLEAKTLWLLKSSPLRPQDILSAKVLLHVLVSLPFLLFASVIFEIAFEMSLVSRIMVLILPVIVNILQALIGIFINLKYPKFDWITEASAVKRGAAPTLSLFLSAAVVLLPFLLYLALHRFGLGADIYLCIVCAVFLLASFALTRLLSTRGAGMFENLDA